MKNQHIIIFLFFIFSFSVLAENNQPLRLVMPNFPPYTYQLNGENTGIGYSIVNKLLTEMSIDYQVNLVKDYGLAVLRMKKGLADGLFLASQNKERDEIAIFSSPLFINRWCWYLNADAKLTPDSADFKHKAKIGTILHTNTHKWLQARHYQVIGKPSSPLALNKMLLTHRVDAVFVAEAVFENAIPKNQHSRFQKYIEVEKPFGIYISKKYNEQHPEVLLTLNEKIKLLRKSSN